MRPFLEEELRIRESTPESTHAGVADEARVLKERVRSLLDLDGKWHPQPAEHKASTGAQQGYAEIFYFPCCNIYVRDFLSTGNYDAPSQLRSDGCQEIPESIRYEYRNPANPFYSSLVGSYYWQNMPIDEYQAKLEKWIDTDNEILIDINLPRSGTGGTLYLLNSATQVEQMIEFARELADRSNNGKAIITCFASITPSRPSFYPVRGKVDKPFIERIRSMWDSERWYSIVSLEDVFPDPLQIISRGSTQQELKNDLVNLRSNWEGHFIGFGEYPFDSSDWAKRNVAYVLETTVGKPDWKKPGEM